MKTLLVSAVVLLTFSEIAHGATKSKCDVVEALKDQSVPDRDIRDCKWFIVRYNCNWLEYYITNKTSWT